MFYETPERKTASSKSAQITLCENSVRQIKKPFFERASEIALNFF
mgnify:CR=1 FL=1